MKKIATLLCALAVGAPIMAAEQGRAILIGGAVVDAAGVSDEGTGYSATWLEPLAKSGRWSGQAGLQRLTDLGGLDSYIVDLDMLANFGLKKRFQAFLGGGVGSVFEDGAAETTATSVTTLGKWGSTPPVGGGGEPGSTSLTVHLEDSDTYLRYSLVGGIRIWLDEDRRFGAVLQYRRSDALQDAGGDREQDGIGLALAIPTP